MPELPAANYPLIRSIYTTLDLHLGPQAALAGRVPARVLVDDPVKPGAAILWLKHRIYLAGAPEAEFMAEARQVIKATILPEAQAAKRERFLVYYPAHLSDLATALLEDIPHTQEWRLELEFDQLKLDWGALLPEQVLLQQVDSWLLSRKGVIGREAIAQALMAEGLSLEVALQTQFGMCLLRRRLIVARCLAEYAGDRRCELGILTHPDYRRQGLATIVAATTIERALFHGITRIGWHCWEKNLASANLAEKLGFVINQRYPVLTGKTNI